MAIVTTRTIVLVILGIMLSAGVVFSTETVDSTIDLGLPTLFVDCYACDQTYMRENINMVDFVRDRKQADIHIFVTGARTGAGGTEYNLEFIGQNGFDGVRDTLKWVATDSDTDDMIRTELTQTIQAGLVRYIARQGLLANLSISYQRPTTKEEVVDNWDSWVFSIDMNGYTNGRKTGHHFNTYGNISARRVTDDLKLSLSGWGNYSEDKFEVGEDYWFSSSSGKGGNAAAYFAINDHWSWALSSSISSTTYSNQDTKVSSYVGLEYNYFPYSEYNSRQLRLQSWFGESYVDYTEETIYDKQNEWLTSHSANLELELVQPWGTIDASLSGSYYLHDIDRNSLGFYTRLSLRVVEGLSVHVDGNYRRVNNQLSLPKGDASTEDILLQRRELATTYSYWASFGFSYSFGSRYNSIVNPRF